MERNRTDIHAPRSVISGLVGAALVLALTVPAAVGGEIRWRSGATDTQFKSSDEVAQVVAALAPLRGDEERHFVVQFDRPIGSSERAALAAAGVRLLNYVGDHAFFASTTADGIDAAALSAVRSLRVAVPIERDWKLHPSLVADVIHDWTVVDFGKDGTEPRGDDALKGPQIEDDPIVGTYVLFHPDVPLAPKGEAIVRLYDGRIRSYLRSINGMVVDLPASQIKALAEEDGVQYIEPPLPKFSELNNSNRDRTGAGIVQDPPYGLDGTGVSVLVYDGGYGLSSHADFGGRHTTRDTSGLSDHATHVAGTIGGSGAQSGGLYRGMAPNVTIESYGFEQPGGLQPGFLYTDPGDLEADYGQAINVYGADISNNSIGTNTAPNGYPCDWTGDYGVTSALIDAVVRGSLGAPFRVVWANGNERQTSRCGDLYHTTAPPAGAKNHLTVGALNSNDDSVTSFTSWGPVDDGRIKPDVSAPGCQSDDDNAVTSCSSGGGYTTKCGTSMASPTVCGLGALLLQDYRAHYPGEPDFRNSTLRAVFAHTAADIEQVGPDYKTGYGSVRIEPAINLMRAENWVEESVDNGGMYSLIVVVLPGDPELKVTLAWDDVPGTPNVSPSLVNDLDLRVFDPSGARRFPWTLDPLNPGNAAVKIQEDHINNIEQVQVSSPAAGAWRVEIHGFNVPQGPQPFSVAATPYLVNCSDQGVISLDRTKYACESTATVQVVDCDLNTDDNVAETITVTVTSTSEPIGEQVLLTETANESAQFRGTLTLSETDAAGVLFIAHGDVVTATYIDADDGMGGINVTVTDDAQVDCTAPVISNVQAINVEPRSATITYDTDEPAFGTVHYGLSCGVWDDSADGGLATSQSINLRNLTDNTVYFYAVEAEDEAANVVLDDNGGSCYSLTTPEVPDFFTEEFGGDNDLADLTITFIPNGSNDFYGACTEPNAGLPTDPAGGTTLTLTDDGSATVNLSGASVLLYGASYSTMYVNANGNITFDSASSTYTESLGSHFGSPRISALFDDLNPSVGGTVSWKQLADRAVVTWQNVPEFNTSNANTFQIEMFFDGQIVISFESIAAGDGIAGLSGGEGLDPDFFETDLSGLGACGPRPPAAANEFLQTPMNTPLAITLSATDDGLPDPPAAITYSITSLPTHLLRDPGNNHVIMAGDLPYQLQGAEVTYLPGFGYAGVDSFHYRANDGGVPPEGGDSNTATVEITVGGPQQVYFWPFDSNPGWVVEGDWAFGQPLGMDGDPNSGFTGTNVYGYNLSGEYTNNMPERALTTKAIDCSALSGTELRFRRWLGVESATWDHASLRISTDGLSWTTLWEHTGATLRETNWSLQTHDISDIADGVSTVYLRWVMGQTDGSVTYHGWNIDDVEIWGLVTVQGCASTSACPEADVNCDNVVSGLDIAVIGSSANFGLNAVDAANPRADVNGDGVVSGLDVAAASSSACFGQ